jgi:hypothetical protein
LAGLESLKTFWDVMDEIDEKTWVLEPEKPMRSATARRIALGRGKRVRAFIFRCSILYFIIYENESKDDS